VLLIHQGGATPEQFDQIACSQLSGPIVGLVKQLDPAIRLVISAHTHQGYLCEVDGRIVTQAEQSGQVLTRISMSIDTQSQAVSGIKVRNVLMESGSFAPDPALAGLLAEVKSRSKDVLSRPIARLALPRISDKLDAAGSSPLGDIATDAQLAATSVLGAQIVFINHKSLRGELVGGTGGATYAQVAATHPYGNSLVLMSLSGAQIHALLEQQSWLASEAATGRRMLQVSNGFSYRWDAKAPQGARVVSGSLMLNGAPLVDTQKYRVSVNSFMAQGGDGYTVLTEGTERLDSGMLDLDVFIDYLTARDRAGSPLGSEQPAGRIVRVN
jgi:5'-nucleotidase